MLQRQENLLEGHRKSSHAVEAPALCIYLGTASLQLAISRPRAGEFSEILLCTLKSYSGTFYGQQLFYTCHVFCSRF